MSHFSRDIRSIDATDTKRAIATLLEYINNLKIDLDIALNRVEKRVKDIEENNKGGESGETG